MTTGGLTSRYCPVCYTITEGPFRPGPGGRPDASCPECMSLERQRFLAIVLDGLAPVLDGAELFVDVAPSPQTSKLFQALRPKRYVRVDIDPAADGRQVDVQASLTHLPFADSSVAAMVCYHVLEHIADDSAAMREITRVLAPHGLAIVQVPWRPNAPTDEDPDAGRDERIRRFGQADHVRYYGRDFEDRLRAAGLDVRRFTPGALLGASACAWMNLKATESVWLLRRMAAHRSLDAVVQSTGALAASLEVLLSRQHLLEHELEAVKSAARSAQSARADADRWKQRFEDLHEHWVRRHGS